MIQRIRGERSPDVTRRLVLGLVTLLTLTLAPQSSAQEDAGRRFDAVYQWPLDAPPELTSTFCEFRDGHFHAGIDLTTFGREGIPVMAVEDGEVVRVRAGARGYGRAVYLRLRDGRLAVYAHLQRFMGPLADYVADVQENRSQYRVDLYPEAGRFPVERGQIIAWSGASGAGGAHLHFELREGDIAINPLSHGLETKDALAPTLRALVLTPLDGESRVNGSVAKQRLAIARDAVEVTPSVWGRMLVGLDGFDRAGKRASRLGLYRVELEVDGRTLMRTGFERFSYFHNHEVYVEFDLDEVLVGRKHVLNLYVPQGITGDFHGEVDALDGVLETTPGAPSALESGRHVLLVKAYDAAGNVSRARMEFDVVEPVHLSKVRAERVGERDLRFVIESAGSSAPVRMRVERGPFGGPFELVGELPVEEGAVQVPDALEAGGVPANVAWRLTGLAPSSIHGGESNRAVVVWTGDSVETGARPSSGGEVAFASVGESIDCEVTLDPGTRVAALNVRWRKPLRQPAEAILDGVALRAPDSHDAYHSRFTMPAGAPGALVLRGISVTGDLLEWSGEPGWTPVPRNAVLDHVDPDARARLRLPEGAFFEPAYVWTGAERPGPDLTEALPEGLELVSSVVRFEPGGLPLDKRGEVAIQLEPGRSPDGVSIYRFEDGEHSWEGTRVDENTGHIGGRVRRLGRFFLARDTAPPTLEARSPRDGSTVESSRPLLSAKLDDAGSGLDESDIVLRLDGARRPVEWDPDADLMRYRPRDALTAGEHSVEFQVTDRAGLTSRVTVRFVVP